MKWEHHPQLDEEYELKTGESIEQLYTMVNGKIIKMQSTKRGVSTEFMKQSASIRDDKLLVVNS